MQRLDLKKEKISLASTPLLTMNELVEEFLKEETTEGNKQYLRDIAQEALHLFDTQFASLDPSKPIMLEVFSATRFPGLERVALSCIIKVIEGTPLAHPVALQGIAQYLLELTAINSELLAESDYNTIFSLLEKSLKNGKPSTALLKAINATIDTFNYLSYYPQPADSTLLSEKLNEYSKKANKEKEEDEEWLFYLERAKQGMRYLANKDKDKGNWHRAWLALSGLMYYGFAGLGVGTIVLSGGTNALSTIPGVYENLKEGTKKWYKLYKETKHSDKQGEQWYLNLLEYQASLTAIILSKNEFNAEDRDKLLKNIFIPLREMSLPTPIRWVVIENLSILMGRQQDKEFQSLCLKEMTRWYNNSDDKTKKRIISCLYPLSKIHANEDVKRQIIDMLRDIREEDENVYDKILASYQSQANEENSELESLVLRAQNNVNNRLGIVVPTITTSNVENIEHYYKEVHRKIIKDSIYLEATSARELNLINIHPDTRAWADTHLKEARKNQTTSAKKWIESISTNKHYHAKVYEDIAFCSFLAIVKQDGDSCHRKSKKEKKPDSSYGKGSSALYAERDAATNSCSNSTAMLSAPVDQSQVKKKERKKL